MALHDSAVCGAEGAPEKPPWNKQRVSFYRPDVLLAEPDRQNWQYLHTGEECRAPLGTPRGSRRALSERAAFGPRVAQPPKRSSIAGKFRRLRRNRHLRGRLLLVTFLGEARKVTRRKAKPCLQVTRRKAKLRSSNSSPSGEINFVQQNVTRRQAKPARYRNAPIAPCGPAFGRNATMAHSGASADRITSRLACADAVLRRRFQGSQSARPTVTPAHKVISDM